MSRVLENIRVNGAPLYTDLANQVSKGRLKLSARSVTSFDFTILDQQDLRFTAKAGQIFREGTVILWDDYALGLSAFDTGGGASAPTVDVSATSSFVRSLKKETGGKNWGTLDVSPWAIGVIRSKAATSYVQPSLGERPIERTEDEGNGTDPMSTWDVMAEMAKQTGAWLFEYGNRIILARPSWLVNQPYTRRYKIHYNTWTDHTDALTAAPQYSWNEDAKPWAGREKLTLKVMDPPFGTFPLSKARPGDIIDYTGAAAVTEDPTWLVVDVEHSIVTGTPVSITCWRPIDPPEILPDSKDGGDSAGVPTGPIGRLGWQGEQLRNASEIVKEGQRRELPRLALDLAVACAMGESSLLNKGFGDVAGPDSTGLFQQRNTWGPRSVRMQPSGAAGLFFDALVKTDYRGRYNNGGTALAAADTGPIYIGPGKSANAASVTIHHVQINADPRHYAQFWADAQLVVQACIDAGKDDDAASGGTVPLTGPKAARIEGSMKAMEGKLIEYDGAFLYQCVDVGKKYVNDVAGIRSFSANGNQFWKHPALMTKFAPISAGKPMRKGDIVGWAGNHGAYPNGGVGHVAIFSHMQGGVPYFLSQNPGPARVQPLQTLGIQGMMRLKD